MVRNDPAGEVLFCSWPDRPLNALWFCAALFMRFRQRGSIVFGALLACLGLNAKDIAISPASLPDGTVGVAYSQTLKAAGCSGSCVWSSAGTLPPGLSLGTTNGVLGGTPGSAGSFHFTVTVSDQKSQTGSQSYTLDINAALTITTPSPLPDGIAGTSYSQTLAVTGGVSPYTWSVVTGALPAGISLNVSNGTVSGTPTTANAFAFTVQVVDKNRLSASKAFTLTVQASTPPLAITTSPTLAGGVVGVSYSQSISASGGTTPYTWSVTAGSLPPGLSLDASSGSITGTPSSANTFSFTVQVKAANGATASKAFTLTIAAGTPKLTITSTSPLPGGTVQTGYSQSLTASGGTPPYNWSVISGALPDGLGLNSAGGVIAGTPAKAGTFPFTVRVTDQSSAVADQSLQITIGSAPASPTLNFSGVPDTVGSGVQMPFDLVLSSPASQQVTGQVVLSFQPDAAVARDDPAIQFSTGSRTVSFTIPAGAAKAVFPSGALAFQTGTVAGTLNLTVSSSLSTSSPNHSVVVARAGPFIQSAVVVQNSSGFQIQITGFSNTRELAGASFHFNAASGQIVQTSDLTVSLASPASQWYTGSTSTQFGGQFLLVVPFTVSQGAASGLSSVAVQLQNGNSTSRIVTTNF